MGETKEAECSVASAMNRQVDPTSGSGKWPMKFPEGIDGMNGAVLVNRGPPQPRRTTVASVHRPGIESANAPLVPTRGETSKKSGERVDNVGAKKRTAEASAGSKETSDKDSRASPTKKQRKDSVSGEEKDDDDEPAPVEASTEGSAFFGDHDVLSGRGGGTNVHPGNRYFRDLINHHRRGYLKARKNDKPSISRSIVRSVRVRKGRFLKRDESSGLWFEIGDDAAREKTSQALRQRAPEMRRILHESEQERAKEEQYLQHQELLKAGYLAGIDAATQATAANPLYVSQGRLPPPPPIVPPMAPRVPTVAGARGYAAGGGGYEYGPRAGGYDYAAVGGGFEQAGPASPYMNREIYRRDAYGTPEMMMQNRGTLPGVHPFRRHEA